MAAALKRRAERYQQGRDLRTRVPREAHAELHGPLDRDPVAILAESDAERVGELLPLRYKLMTADPFGFLRGGSVRVSSGRGGGDGDRSRASTARRGPGASLRRLSSDELRRVQFARRQHPF